MRYIVSSLDMRTNKKYHQIPQFLTWAYIILPNGARCNYEFWYACVNLGLFSFYDDLKCITM